MIYPFMQLEDDTEIVHSDISEDGTVKVYIETPVYGGFHSAYCYLPTYEWKEIVGFTQAEIDKFQKIIESSAHSIIRSAKDAEPV